MTDNRSSPGSATSPIGQSDVEMLRHLADSLGFGRTHDMLRRVIAACPYLTVDAAQRSPRRVDDHMMRARRLVENHIEAFGMVPHPDLIKDAIADMSQQSFDLGFRAAGGSVSLPSTHSEGRK